jgi:regulator of nucleoside diphosphate kinase
MNVNRTCPALTNLPAITLTIGTFCRLDSLLAAEATGSWRPVAQLARKLKQSIVMDEDQIPSSVATMHARIEFRTDASVSHVATLVYPGEGHLYEDALSILTPVGSALLGLSERQSMSFAAPDGTTRTVTVLRILYQPEAERRRRNRRRSDERLGAVPLEAI